MKRAPGEDFDAYRQRRKESNVFKKTIGRLGKWFHQGGTYRKKEIVPGPKRVLISAAVGKRHKVESVEHFKQRRRFCNAQRREREKERKHRLTPTPVFMGSLEYLLTTKPLSGSMSLP